MATRDEGPPTRRRKPETIVSKVLKYAWERAHKAGRSIPNRVDVSLAREKFGLAAKLDLEKGSEEYNLWIEEYKRTHAEYYVIPDVELILGLKPEGEK